MLLAALTVTELDLFGIERRVPSAENVAAVHVMAAGETAYMDSPEGVAETMALHRAIIDHKPQQDQCDQKAFFLRGRSDDYQTLDVHVTYHLKGGDTLSRSYRLAHRHDEKGDDAGAVQALLNCPEAVTNRKATPFDFTWENVSYGHVNAVMPAPECAAAAGYDDPETYVLCELAGYTRSEAAALSDELRSRALRDALANYRYVDETLYYDASGALREKYSGYIDYSWDYTEADPSIPMKDGGIDWDRIWLDYERMLTKQEAWELWDTCIRPDLKDNALGRVWILADSDYAATVCSAGVEIDVREPEERTKSYMPAFESYEIPATMPAAEAESGVRYYAFSTVPTVDSTRANAWLEAHGIRLYTVGEVRSAVLAP